MATAGGVTRIGSLRSKSVLDKLQVKNSGAIEKGGGKIKEETKEVSSIDGTVTHQKMTKEELAKRRVVHC